MKTFKFDIQTLLILLLGIAAVFMPIAIKTNSLSYLISPVALSIVVVGTFCAGAVSFSLKSVISAFLSLKNLFLKKDKKEFIALTDEIIELSKIARARGVGALYNLADEIQNEKLKSAIETMLETADEKTLEDALRFDVFLQNREDFKNIEIFEELGGYSPTFGMLGALAGLIQVSVISPEPKLLLTGIAGAFVATLYGVIGANLIFLPLAKKLELELNEKLLEQEVIITSILDISKETSSIIISEKIDKMLVGNNISKGGKLYRFAA